MNTNATSGSDEQLVREIQRLGEAVGQHEDRLQYLWTLLFQRYQKLLYSIAYRACNGNREDAADLLQDVQLELVKAIPQYEGRSGASVKTFICKIAQNVVSTWFERKGRIPVPEEEVDRIIDSTQAYIDNSATEPFIDDVVDVVITIRQHLSLDELQALWFMFEAFSHRETAAILDITEEASRQRRARVAKDLRAICMRNHLPKEELGEAIGRLENLLEAIRRLYESLAQICGRHQGGAQTLCEALREAIRRLERLQEETQDRELNRLATELREELREAAERVHSIAAVELHEAIRRGYDEKT